MSCIYGKVKDVVAQIGVKNIVGLPVLFVGHSTGISGLYKGVIAEVIEDRDQDFKYSYSVLVKENNKPGSCSRILSFEYIAVIGGAA